MHARLKTVQKAEIVSLLGYSHNVEATHYAPGGRGTGKNKFDHEIPGMAFKLRTPPDTSGPHPVSHTSRPGLLVPSGGKAHDGQPLLRPRRKVCIFIVTNYTTCDRPQTDGSG